MCFLFPVSCLLLFFTSCLFASYPVFCFISPEIKVDELRKKQEISKKYVVKNIIVDKMIVQRRKKQKIKKQETGNKELIVE